MKVLSWPEKVEALVFDVDGTLYPECPEYTRHQREMDFAAIAELQQRSPKEVEEWFSRKKEELCQQHGHSPSPREVFLELGIGQEWLLERRCALWEPEKFLSPYPGLESGLDEVCLRYPTTFASRSHSAIVWKILRAIGLKDVAKRHHVHVIGIELAKSKPYPDVFHKAASLMHTGPPHCLSIGDDEYYDAFPAAAIGMGAVVVSGMDDLMEVIRRLLNKA